MDDTLCFTILNVHFRLIGEKEDNIFLKCSEFYIFSSLTWLKNRYTTIFVKFTDCKLTKEQIEQILGYFSRVNIHIGVAIAILRMSISRVTQRYKTTTSYLLVNLK